MAEEVVDPTLDHPFFKHSKEWLTLSAERRKEVYDFLVYGEVPKNFVYELLCDNFRGAVGKCPADEVETLPTWAKILNEYMPMASHGSKVRVESYARSRRDLNNDGTR